jgi:Ca-activated chloride channel family protein
MGQNWLLHRKALNRKEICIGLFGGLLAGAVSGGTSQQLFSLAASTMGNDPFSPGWMLRIGQVVGWGLLGGLLGLGLSLFIPNLPRSRAAIGGVIGGFLGAVAFLVSLEAAGETGGRLMGAVTLGFAIGLCIAFAELIAREAVLVVHWAPNEETTVNLGNRPVVLGSSSEAHIYLPREKGFPAVAATVVLKSGKVEMENKMTNTTHVLQGGNKLQVGPLTIEVRTFT